ncbi:MAG: flavodoxin family protein [Coriobacteriales bacterium]|jgi:multimeric flavodoxin WrbA
MKVLLVNGSSHKNGNTMAALNEMVRTFQEEGVETEIIQIGGKPIADCLQCGRCSETGRCIISDDGVNDFLDKAADADGFVFASPTYFAHPSGRLLSFLDRAFYADAKGEIYPTFAFKPGAAVTVARRGGTSATLDVINKHFGIAQMPIAGSTYWNMVHGLKPGEASQDEEGMQTLRNLARNMVWMMRSFADARAAGTPLPATEGDAMTNFVRDDDRH